MERYKVVFHINQPDRWPALLANVNNVIKDLGSDNITVEVVANGIAVVDYVPNRDDNSFMNKLVHATKLGVKFTACRNSLVSNNIDESHIPDFIKIVPAGVTELIKKQSDGYAYIKP